MASSPVSGDLNLWRGNAGINFGGYTINNAYASFEEDDLGSITPGKLADNTVLSKDIMTIPDDSIPSARVVYTIIGGQIRYDADGS
jgi:predicted amidohydrolase YtcJ